ncbi:MAG: hypothetical protein FD163_952 [Hyphomonadaceae bacterium]|nr:MAG: hypothetical protein FD163_952 [Hyphomonadaceae bacterium]
MRKKDPTNQQKEAEIADIAPDVAIEFSVSENSNFPVASQSEIVIQDEDFGAITFDAIEEETNGLKARKIKKPNHPPYLFMFSLLTATIWIIAALLYLNSNTQGISQLELFTMVIALLGPAGLSVLAGAMGESIVSSNREAKALVRAARKLVEPSKAAEEAAKSTLSAVRGEVERLENAIQSAASQLGNLENTIEIRTVGLRKASEEAKSGADALVNTMESERVRLSALLEALAELTKSAQISTKTGAQGIETSAALLSKAAEGLNAKSIEAINSAGLAANRLDEALGKTLEAISGLDQASARGEVALTSAHDLMVQARISANDAVSGVSGATQSLQDAANRASETAKEVSQIIARETEGTRGLSIKTIDDVRKIAEQSAIQIVTALRAETDKAKLIAEDNLATLDATSNSIKRLAAEANQYVTKQVGENRIHLESIRQQNYEINQAAGEFVENRIVSAKDLIAQSTSLLNDAGMRIEHRFNDVVKSCSDQARAVEDVIESLNRKLDALPAEAVERAVQVETALEETLKKLSETGRKAADETRALDESFQERLRQSYSALNEVVQRLGGFSSAYTPPSPRELRQSRDEVAQNVELPHLPLHERPSAAPIPLDDGNQNSAEIEPKSEMKFTSVLQPKTQIRSTPAQGEQNAPPPIEESPYPQNSPSGLRGRILSEENSLSRDLEMKSVTPAPEMPAKTQTERSYNPFGGVSFQPSSKNDTERPSDWSWRDVLSEIDKNDPHKHDNFIHEMVVELGLQSVPQQIIDRLIEFQLHNPQSARQQVRNSLSLQVNALENRIAQDFGVRNSLIEFVSTNAMRARRGQLSSLELRLYLVADCALSVLRKN